MEQKDHLQINPDDSVTLYKYRIDGEKKKRREINNDRWNEVIARNDALIIVDKNINGMYICSCSAAKSFAAMNDACQIIGLWYDLVLEEYNEGLEDHRKFRTFGRFFNQINDNRHVRRRATNIFHRLNMTILDIEILQHYKAFRNGRSL